MMATEEQCKSCKNSEDCPIIISIIDGDDGEILREMCIDNEAEDGS